MARSVLVKSIRGATAKLWILIYSIMVFVSQLVLVVIAVFALVVYRVAVYAVLAASSDYNTGAVNMATSGTAALLNLITIMLLNKVPAQTYLILWRRYTTTKHLEVNFCCLPYHVDVRLRLLHSDGSYLNEQILVNSLTPRSDEHVTSQSDLGS